VHLTANAGCDHPPPPHFSGGCFQRQPALRDSGAAPAPVQKIPDPLGWNQGFPPQYSQFPDDPKFVRCSACPEPKRRCPPLVLHPARWSPATRFFSASPSLYRLLHQPVNFPHSALENVES